MSKGGEYVLDRRIMTSLISLFGLRLIQTMSLLYTPIILQVAMHCNINDKFLNFFPLAKKLEHSKAPPK